MKIIIDARFFGTETGIGRYVKELVENLEKVDFDNQYVIFLSSKNQELYWPKNSNFQKRIVDIKWYSLKEQLLMGSLIDKERGDLCFFPHFNVPFFCRTPYAIMIHDLILRQFPTSRASTLGPLKFYIKYFFYNLILRRAIRRAKKIIVPTYFVRNEIIKEFKTNPDKVRVVYEGLSRLPRQADLGEAVLREKGIAGSYILYVGNAYPHKNLERLIEAFYKLKKEHPGLQLVLVGKRDYFSKRLEEETREKYSKFNIQYPQDILFYGYASDEELVTLYKHAKIYIFPSLIEGFGLPPLEALSFGLPIVCSDIPVFHEVLGDAVLYFNPRNIENIKETLQKCLAGHRSDAGINKLLVRYDFQKTAKECLEVFYKIGKINK
ncbi:glycosyltransferase family 4 protein [Patescibacteria group bacterium]|nr:glycosyltransferase family 4 protein [Patescibacteria group bacterium]